jgi:ubiquinone/menaquinone biosynthesis C-methylase UbiE
MRRKAHPRVEESGLDVQFIDLPGEQIPLEENSVDTVLVTYSLCTIPDVVTALEGMRRVLKPGGRLLYCEHGKAPDESVMRWQNRIDPIWSRFAGGCHINKDIPAIVKAGGFEITDDKRRYIPGPRFVSYNYWGTAVAVG